MSSDRDFRVNILAVDDSPDKLLALTVVLAELNQNVVTATSGRDALRALLTDEFAVVLLDVNMPGMDGFETAALIRQRRTSEHTPIIFITSYGDETHATRGYSLGAVDYILAPVDPEILRTKVMVFVELFRKTAQIKQQARSLEQKALQLQRLTEASLAINSALSPDEMLQVVTDMARDIVGAHQAVAVAAVDQKWLQPIAAVSLSARYEAGGERAVLRDRTALLSFLSQLHRTLRVPRGDPEGAAAPQGLLASDGPARLGWLATPLCGRDGRHLGLIHLLDKRDGDFTDEDEAIVTQLAQMTSIAMENTLNTEAREANRIKDEFLTTLSHELRTPLSAILGWTRTLRSGSADPAKVVHGLEVIERNVRAQTRLIDDLLDVSRIITGKLRLTVRPAAFTPIIEAALDAVRPAAEAKDIQIAIEHRGPGVEDIVVGDPDRLQQVIWNLVSNAIKFTPPGGRVTIELSPGNAEFEIRVSDTGRGISPEFLPRVFERFRQADSSTTRSQGGLGIGLAIARHLVELHGGTISAQSDGENAGSVFTVRLPRIAVGIHTVEAAPIQEEPSSALAGNQPGNIRGLRVLLVEDEQDGRELMAEMLGTAGAQVTAVESARDALDVFTDERPDVVVSDIGMPDEDGYSLIRAIRALPPERGGAVPAIAVTAYAREEDRLRALAAGFQWHVAKPVDPAELVAALARVAVTAAPDAAGLPPSASAYKSGNGDQPLIRVLVVEDDVDSREGLKNLLEIWGHAVDVAGTGREGIEQAIRHRPGVALIDIGLPELDGYQVAQRIREALGTSDIFLVAITGYADARARQQALENGFDAHVAKPIDFSKLSSILAARVGAA